LRGREKLTGERRTKRKSRYYWRVKPGAPPYRCYEVPNLQTIEEQREGSSEPDIEREKTPETEKEQKLMVGNEGRQDQSMETIADSPSGEGSLTGVSNDQILTWDMRLRTELVELGGQGKRPYIPLRRLMPHPRWIKKGMRSTGKKPSRKSGK